MKQLSDQELNIKIARFLEDRFSAHPEIEKNAQARSARPENMGVVSRVKNVSKRLLHTPVSTLYQGR